MNNLSENPLVWFWVSLAIGVIAFHNGYFEYAVFAFLSLIISKQIEILNKK